MTIFPTITTGTPPLVVTTGVNPNITYATIINMLGEWSLLTEMIGYYPQSVNQLSSQFFYQTYESNANFVSKMLITLISPRQYNSSSFIGLQDTPLLFEGSASLAFMIQPREQIQLNFIGKDMYKRYALGTKNPFAKIAEKIDKSGFFDDFSEEIE